MSKRWGSDYVVAEHRDLQANTMAVDATGSLVLLAGRRYFAVKQLDEGADTLRKFQRQSKYEVGSAEWNPNSQNCHLCAISSNNRVEVLSFLGGDGYDLTTTHSLRAHTRVVSDLNWHPTEPDILASCSIDTFIHVWDIRDQRRPCLSLSAVAGASQVRWNCLSQHILATAHDGDIKIWDQRKGNSPMQYIAAHLTKIHGLDWCPIQQNQLATSSQDCTVKIFDVTNPRRAESILTTSAPVWRARYTPFGEGLVTIVVPQLRRGENSLLLWNTSNLTAPIYTFIGHTDVVLEFQWRHKKKEPNDFELITWSKDQCLRIFKIDPFLQKLCGHDLDDGTVYAPYTEDSNLRTIRTMEQQMQDVQNDREVNYMLSKIEDGKTNAESIVYSATDKEVSSPTQPKTLQQEFSLININIPNIEVNAMDAEQRSCRVTAANKNYNVILKVNFPGNYPYNAPPSFQFCPGTTIDNTAMAKLSKVLKQTAQQRVRKNRSCLEPCLRQLITTLEQMCVSEESEGKHLGYRMQHSSNFRNPNSIFPNYQDTYIPFPRTSGAKFCCVGTLVCFGRTPYARRPSIKPESTTPRALSALGSGVSNNGHFPHIYPPYSQSNATDNISISSFYFQERRGSRRSLHGSSRQHSKGPQKNNPTVTIYDASALFFVNKELAEKYIINITDIPGMCQYNAGVAATLERPDLVQAWCLAALVISQPLSSLFSNCCHSSDIETPWPQHPFGQNLIHSLIQHYASQSDIQMAGMLSCTFSYRSDNHDSAQGRAISKSVNVSPGGSPYHTIHPADTTLEGWNFQNLKQHRSNSWSESLDDLKFIQDSLFEPGRSIRLLDEKNTSLYDSYKKAYAEVLHRWRLLDARAQVLKHVSVPPIDSHKAVDFQIECYVCKKFSQGPQCNNCRRLAFQCVICHISVRGPSNVCVVCGHGGHTEHLAAWFTTKTLCPTGCGCNCLNESTTMMKN
ncbi:GATOR complex protein WDR59 isoform X2 [Athalia rosae]|uniref:GATOR complex protein WDR59 isoform X2 n=1 Tax=Athalia rosae TaxID=37344 RepID=UPI002033F281|nr:GATOR complex protein WDR59 isoform X2 [Athalia rosae]